MDDAAARIMLRVTSRQSAGLCPCCAASTSRVHSHYTRALTDLPWAHYRVRLQLSVRKFFCDNASCSRRIFTERLPAWSRRGRDGPDG